MQSHSNRCRCGPGQACDLEHRQIGVVAQEHRDTLVWRKFTKRIRQQRRQHSRPGHIRCRVRCLLRLEKTLAPKLRGTQPKRRAKHPRNWIPHSLPMVKQPHECLRSRLVRNLPPSSRHHQQRTPDLAGMRPEYHLYFRLTGDPTNLRLERTTYQSNQTTKTFHRRAPDPPPSTAQPVVARAVLRPNPTDSHVYARPSDHSPGTARDGSLHLRRPQNQRSTVSHCCVTSPSPAVTHHSARESKGTNPVNPPITTLVTPRVTVRTSLGAPNSLPVKPRMGRLLERLPRGAP